jgi:hypothetical protein
LQANFTHLLTTKSASFTNLFWDFGKSFRHWDSNQIPVNLFLNKQKIRWDSLGFDIPKLGIRPITTLPVFMMFSTKNDLGSPHNGGDINNAFGA